MSERKNKMVLGTVELGLDYGINNDCGKPSNQQAFDLLDAAWNNGITELDTAAAYGDSEKIIGEYQKETGHYFLIDTKLPVSIKPAQYDSCLETSLERLHVPSLHTLYLHSFKQCLDKSILDFLNEQKKIGKIKQIGISIYEPDEMSHILDHLPFVDTIQFPYNVLDHHRWTENGLLKRAKDNGKKMYVRSVFLQGLVFKSPSDAFVKTINAGKYLETLGRLAGKNGLSIAELAFQYVWVSPDVDKIIIGCQGKDDVIRNVAMIDSSKPIDGNVRTELEKTTTGISNQVIDPRNWKKQ